MTDLETTQFDCEWAQNPHGEFYCPQFQGQTFAKNSAKSLYDHFLEASFFQENTLYLICGTDAGLLIDYIKQKFTAEKKGRHFVFIDFESVTDEESFRLNAGEDDSMVSVIHPSEESFLTLRNRFIDYFISKKIRLLKSLSVIDKVSSGYDALWRFVTEQYMQLQYYETYNYTKPFVDAQLQNLSCNLNPILSIKDRLKDRQALLLGGGPSIDLVIDWVKQNREKFIIFSVGRIAHRLMQEELFPDFFVSADPHDVSYDNSKGLLNFSERSILLNCYHVTPKLVNQWGGISAYYGPRFPWETAAENSASPGPTVIHSALTQAVFLGCSEVYLAGVDLCFYQGKTHESSSAESAYGKMAIKHLLTVDTYNGQIAETGMPFYQGIQALGAMAQTFRDRFGTRIYNLSENAAKVPDVHYANPESIELATHDDKQLLMQSIRDDLLLSCEDRIDDTENTLKVVQTKRRFLQEQKTLCKKAMTLSGKIAANPKNESKVVKLKSTLEKKLGDQAHMLFHYGYKHFADTMRPVEDEQNMTMEEIEHTLHSYFRAMNRSLDEFSQELEKAIRTLKFRLKEYRTETLAELKSLWIEREEIGRFKLWSSLHEQAAEREENLRVMNALQALFDQAVNDQETVQSQSLKHRATNWKNLFSKVQTAYEKEDEAELQALQSSLEQMDQSAVLDALQAMVKAMMLELSGQTSNALEVYRSINHPNLQLFALKRVLHFAMQARDHEQVLKTLESLVRFSHDYMVPYADYMALLGQPASALQILQMYLSKHTDNLIAWVKLADLAQAQSENELLALAVTNIQRLDPDNPELKRFM